MVQALALDLADLIFPEAKTLRDQFARLGHRHVVILGVYKRQKHIHTLGLRQAFFRFFVRHFSPFSNESVRSYSQPGKALAVAFVAAAEPGPFGSAPTRPVRHGEVPCSSAGE
jgi:hypothetical protein